MEPLKHRSKLQIKGYVDHFNHAFCKVLDQLSENINDPKDIVFSDSIRPLFELMADKTMLKQRSVSLVNFSIESFRRYSDLTETKLVFVVKPEEKNFEIIESIMKILRAKDLSKACSLVLYPKRTALVNTYISRYNLKLHFFNSIYDLNFGLIPLSSDLLSLEDPTCLSDMVLSSSFNFLNESVIALTKM